MFFVFFGCNTNTYGKGMKNESQSYECVQKLSLTGREKVANETCKNKIFVSKFLPTVKKGKLYFLVLLYRVASRRSWEGV